jgi:hypothetical protein
MELSSFAKRIESKFVGVTEQQQQHRQELTEFGFLFPPRKS